MPSLEEVREIGDSYDEVLDEFREAIASARREWSASLLKAYPDRANLRATAEAVCRALHANGVEVNAIHEGRQITLAVSPDGAVTSVPMSDSFCALTVGADRPLAVSDIQNDPIGEGHAARRRKLGSWASVPIHIQDAAAGSLCAIQNEARHWTDDEQAVLEWAAVQISEDVEAWLEKS